MNVFAETVVARSEGVLFTDLDGIVVTMNVDDGEYHELDPIGSRIWHLIERPVSAGEICRRLVDEYDIGSEACLADVIGFLNEIGEMRLIRVEDGGH